MKLIYENDTHRIEMEAGADYNYITYAKCPGFLQEVGRSWSLTKKVTKHFTEAEVSKIKSNVHAIKYVSQRYC